MAEAAPFAAAWSAAPRKDLEEAATALRKSMQGLGTNERDLISTLIKLHPSDMPALKKAYAETQDNRDLVRDIDAETSGNFREVARALLHSSAEYDAAMLNLAIKGLGTKEHVITEIVCTRSPAELKLIGEIYVKKYEEGLLKAIKDDTSGELEDVYVECLKSQRSLPPDTEVESWVDRIYKAGEGKSGTKESEFYQLLCGKHRSFIHKVYNGYAEKYKKALSVAVDNEFSGHSQKALMCLAMPLNEYFADRLYATMKGLGTDDKGLIRLIVSLRTRDIKAISVIFLHKYKKSLKKWIESDCSGDYKRSLIQIIEHAGHIE